MKEHSMKPISILVVEDHPFQQLYLQNLFSEIGQFHLQFAEEGSAALDCLNGMTSIWC